MKIYVKLAALLVALCMLAGAAACGAGAPAGTTAAVAGNETTTQAAASATTAAPTTAVAVTEPERIKPCRIVQPGLHRPEYEIGAAAINEKLLADGLDFAIDVTLIPWDAYSEKLNVMLTTGEPFELLHIMQDVRNLSSIAGIGAVISLEPYLDNYPGLVDKFTELEWVGTLYQGERYAIPCYWKSFELVPSITVRVDVMKKLGYEEFPTEIDDVFDLFQKMQDYILDETGVKAYHWSHQLMTNAAWLHKYYDTYPFYVENSLGIVLSRLDGTIDSYYESEEFKQDAYFYRRLYTAGLIHPDVLNLDHTEKYDQADLGAFLPSATFDSNESVSIKKKTGIVTDVETIRPRPEKPDLIYTFCQNINAISSTSDDPETGIKLLDWVYKNKENHDLFHYGIVGRHYEPVGENKMNVMRNEDDQTLFTLDHWMTGYLPYMRFDAESTESYIENQSYVSKDYVVAPVAGFIFDASKISSELANLQTEIIASLYPIKYGLVDYDTSIESAVAKLKAAGLDTYLDEYRLQFKQYLEDNPWAMDMAKETRR